jgi:crotonobetainyl-CoA:carnitine CoA-transferase CaiB-like acyl-CoA transferase
MRGVMDGVRVLEVAQWWFVPAAGAVLADWGADVIKIEHPVMGDGQRGLAAMGMKSTEGNVDFMMQQSNRGKRSLGLDLASPDGLEVLYKLAEKSDVFLTNFLPDARERLRIDVEHIRARNPNIVYVRGSGQGPKGPDAGKGGYDATSFWSRSGIAHALTPPGFEPPIMQRAAFGDSIGAMTVAGGIAAALFGRERTGRANVVDISLLNTGMWVLAPDVVASKLITGGQGMIPRWSRTSAPNPVGNSYKTKDGRWLLLMMLQADKHWPNFCEHIDRPDMATDPRFAAGPARFQNREACIAILDEIFASRTLDEWREKLGPMEGPWAPMQTAEETHSDRQSIANGYLPECDGGDKGRFKLVASPVQFDEQPLELRGPSPEMGQHTEEVLLELGFEWDEIARLKEAKAIN